jgi:hypothetical protein
LYGDAVRLRTSNTPESGDTAFSEGSPFVRLLGTTGRVRIVDAFLNKSHAELSARDVRELTGISESTFSRNKDVLLELDVIVPVESRTGKQFYRLNTDAELVKLLGEFHSRLWQFGDEVNDQLETEAREYIGEILTTQVSRRRATSGVPERNSADSTENDD